MKAIGVLLILCGIVALAFVWPYILILYAIMAGVLILGKD